MPSDMKPPSFRREIARLCGQHLAVIIIVPASNLARLLVSLEVVVAFVSIIFVLSNFSNFKENA